MNLTLPEAISIGLENNFSIRIARNDEAVAGNNNSLGNAGFFPTVTATGSRNRRIENSTLSFSSEGIEDRVTEGAETNTTSAGVNLNWTLFDGLIMFTTRDRLAELEKQGERQARVTIENQVARIIDAYFNIVRQQKTYQVLENTVEVSEERIDIAETKRDLGSGSEYDLLQARADLNEDRAALIRQEVLINDAKVLLNELLGREASVEFNVVNTIPVNPELEYEELLQKAMSNNLDLSVARVNQRIAELEIKEIRGERFPELDFTAGFAYNQSESESGFVELSETDGFNYGVTARINLFDGLDVNRRIQNAKIQLKNQELALEELKRQVKGDLNREFKSYLNSLRLIDLEQENLRYAEQSLDIALERFRLGTINSIELREAQQTFIDAENRLIQARFEAKLAETELLRLSNGLTSSESVDR